MQIIRYLCPGMLLTRLNYVNHYQCIIYIEEKATNPGSSFPYNYAFYTDEMESYWWLCGNAENPESLQLLKCNRIWLNVWERRDSTPKAGRTKVFKSVRLPTEHFVNSLRPITIYDCVKIIRARNSLWNKMWAKYNMINSVLAEDRGRNPSWITVWVPHEHWHIHSHL